MTRARPSARRYCKKGVRLAGERSNRMTLFFARVTAVYRCFSSCARCGSPAEEAVTRQAGNWSGLAQCYQDFAVQAPSSEQLQGPKKTWFC
jgi:hypothetical protein